MKCPACSETDLLMSERQGVEIDYCPGCRGVWLDRGELDKIVERSNEMSAAPAGTRSSRDDDRHDSDRDHHDDRYGSSGRDGSSKKKKGGLFGDILGGLGG
jgi:Zn-finger nucleic acid-binding protein